MEKGSEKEIIGNMCELTRLKNDEDIEAFFSKFEVDIEEEEGEEEQEEQEDEEEHKRIKRSNNTTTLDSELDNLID